MITRCYLSIPPRMKKRRAPVWRVPSANDKRGGAPPGISCALFASLP